MIPLFIGTYTDGASRGIYRVELDPLARRLSDPVLVATAVNPSFLAWHPTRDVLYVTSEIHAPAQAATATVLAYDVEDEGGLALINEQPTGGPGACFVSVHPAGTHAFVANYGAGSVAALPIREDGGLLPVSSIVQHQGSGPHPVRQPGPRAHAVRPAPGDGFLLAADLGADRVFVYRFDPLNGSLVAHDSGTTRGAPGAGPRHIAEHPSGVTVYVINELDSTIAWYAWDAVRGSLERRGVVSTLPAGFSGENTAAEVAVHQSGRFVYGSNRGHDSIAAFRVEADGALNPAGLYATGGRTPRHFAIDPGGTFLIAANQESDSLALFQIDPGTGALTDTGARSRVPSPVFVISGR